MSDVAIKVESISKLYRIGLKEELHDTFVGAFTSWVKSPIHSFRQLRRLSHFDDIAPPDGEEHDSSQSDIIWALRDISFEVKHGEVLGIIGRNGAGKSTLLKILCRITEPTSGSAKVYGRVASLLEVGTGFHPELTGRENVFLNGAILGMTKREIERKFDEIVDFSEIEKFIDTPVKRYSSGMRVRLAFAVAAHLEPEILLIDEVLAVGDVAFQRKCLGKMGNVAREGRTVLFVSHNMRAVGGLCRAAILLEGGRLREIGDVTSVIQSYLVENDQECTYKPKNNREDFALTEVNVKSETGEKKAQFLYSDKIVIYLNLFSRMRNEWPRVGFTLRDSLGEIVFSSGHMDLREGEIFNHTGSITFRVTIPSCLLNIGRYSLDVSAIYPNIRVVFSHSSCIKFSIEEDNHVPGGYGYDRQGVLRPRLEWEIVSDSPR